MSDWFVQSPRARDPNRKASSGEMMATMARAMSSAPWIIFEPFRHGDGSSAAGGLLACLGHRSGGCWNDGLLIERLQRLFLGQWVLTLTTAPIGPLGLWSSHFAIGPRRGAVDAGVSCFSKVIRTSGRRSVRGVG